jgi:cytidine deaminase
LAESEQVDRLVVAARGVREFAMAPYSRFKVGAALLGSSGRIYTGCNVENASYGLTVCAERVALLKALSEGERSFTLIAVVAEPEAPTPPCGSCRQLLWEYCGDLPIVLANLHEVTGHHHIKALLPQPFDARLLK